MVNLVITYKLQLRNDDEYLQLCIQLRSWIRKSRNLSKFEICYLRFRIQDEIPNISLSPLLEILIAI